jgi:molecular chaperone GrpE (heat shock protein)
MSSIEKGTTDTAAIVSKNMALDFEQLKASFDALKIKYDTLTKLHTDLVKVVDDINRAKLIKTLSDVSNLTVEAMEKMATDELMGYVESFKLIKKPFISIKPFGEEESPMSKLTIPSKFRFGPQVK